MSLSQNDAIDTLMAQYTSGSLSKPASILVEAHLELKPDNRQFIEDLEAVAGVALEQVKPAGLTGSSNTLAAIFASSPDNISVDGGVFQSVGNSAQLPKSLRQFIGCDVEDIPWRTKLPGFKEYDLGEIDGCHVNMFWIRPGRTVPAHTHEGCELSIVLDGAFTDERGRFGKGDISIADASVDHRPKAESDRPCIGFAVLDGDVKLTGSWGQRVGDLIG